MEQAPKRTRRGKGTQAERPPKFKPFGGVAEDIRALVDHVVASRCPTCHLGRNNGEPAVCKGPVPLLNATVCPVTQQQSVAVVVEALRQGQGGWIVTPNLDHIRRCSDDARYAKAVLKADLRLADGMPLVWASRLQRTPLPERVAGSDLIYSLSKALGEEKRSVFLLGGEPGTAVEAAAVLGRRYPGLTIAGTHCPPVGFEHDRQEMKTVRAKLTASQPDLVFVALGSPKQEYLVQTFRSHFPATWWIGVGISFSFVCGRVKRAPKWMQKCGLEWVHRMVQEPRRLAKRYLAHGIPFGLALLAKSLLRRRRRSEPADRGIDLGGHEEAQRAQKGEREWKTGNEE